MSASFYGNILRGKFPLKSKVRLEDDSTGAKLLNILGSDIENTYRRKVFSHNVCNYISTPTPLNNLESLYRYDLLDNENYRTSVMLERVHEITEGEKTRVRSLEELYNSLAEQYVYDDANRIPTDNPVIITLENVKNTFETYKLKKEFHIYVNVKKVLKTEDESSPISSGICIRGKDKNLNPIEETIDIHSERMYVTKQRFFTIEALSQNTKYNITGGASISVSDFKEFEIELLKYPCKTWLENQIDPRDLETADIKRIQIDSFISRAKKDEVILEGAVAENELVVELVAIKDENDNVTSTKLKYIHRYFNDLNAYRNEFNHTDDSDPKDIEDHILEKILGEVMLADNDGNFIVAIDFDYNIVDGHLYVLGEDNKIYVYEIGNKEAPENNIKRTYNPGIRIDVLDELVLPGEITTVRLLNTSLDFPLTSFLVGKKEGEILTFLNSDKSEFGDNIGVFYPLNGGDTQDSLELFSFDVTVDQDDIELFVICFAGTAANINAINNYPNNQSGDDPLQPFIRSIEAKQINTKQLIRNVITPTKVYSHISNSDTVYKHLYFKGTDRTLWVVNNVNTHVAFKPEYDQFYYANNAIFRTKDVANATYTFELTNGENIEVDINEQNT